jgi:hypothetical protein
MDTVDFAALAALFALVVVPGLGAALALYGPRRISLPTRLALVFALGFTVPGLVAYLLAVLHFLQPVPFFVVLGVVTAGLWVRALRLAKPTDHVRALVEEVRSEPWTLPIGLAVILAIAVLRFLYLPGPYTLRWWVDAMEIADAGRVPQYTLIYGGLYPSVTSKIFLNTFNAGAIFAAGREAYGPLAALAWIGSLGLAASLWAVGREVGLRILAPLLPLLVMSNKVFLDTAITRDLGGYKAETFGRMVGFCAVAVGIRALRDRGARTDLVVAAVLLAVTMATHLVPFLVAGALLGWYWVARMILDRQRRVLLVRGSAVLIIGGLVGAAILLLPRGDIGFQGAQRPQQYGSQGAAFDETFYLYTGKTRPVHDERLTPWYVPPTRLLNAFTGEALGLGPSSTLDGLRAPIAFALGPAGIALALVVLRWFPSDLRHAGLVAVGLAGSLFFFALYFSYRYSVWVGGTFGIRRLFEYGTLSVLLMALPLMEAGLRSLRRLRPATPVVLGALVVVVAAAILVPRSHPSSKRAATARRHAVVINTIRRTVPCNARILADQRTVGFFRATTGRVGVLEGMGPFLRPEILHEVVGLLLSARAFFEDPTANTDFLIDQGIDYVVLIKSIDVGYRGPVASRGGAHLRGVPFLRLVQEGEGTLVYRVEGLPGRTGFVDPAGYPGYRCEEDPLSL